MNRSTRTWAAIFCAVAVLILVSCSDDPTEVNVPADQATEAGVNSAMSTTVVPFVTFMGTMSDLLTPPAARSVGGLACPVTTGWCASGTVTCSVGANGYDFDFDECQVVTGDGPMTLDGNVSAVPGTTVVLTLTNLFINNSPAISGTGTINLAACNYFVNVHTNKATVAGTVTMCDADPYPTGDSLVIGFGDFLVTIFFNGSSIAPATAMRNGIPVATCDIDLEPDPPISTCHLI